MNVEAVKQDLAYLEGVGDALIATIDSPTGLANVLRAGFHGAIGRIRQGIDPKTTGADPADDTGDATHTANCSYIFSR